MTSPIQPGEILAGKYRVERVLGMGGMGVVVAAWHLQLEERVALKFMLPEALANAEAVARFSREARAAVKIKSEHVARVSDVGRLESGAPYMVMEFLEGEDLHHLLSRTGPLPAPLAVDYVLQACEAVAEAHSLGIVHRDIKPSNLFVVRQRDGRSTVKVLDFGISKGGGGPGSSGVDMTRTSAVLGSPLYMSPEQLESSKSADQRSDIWAIGVTLFELLSASKPFAGDTLPEVVHAVMAKPPAALPGVPKGLEAVVLRCLLKDRGARFQSIAELATALAEFAPPSARISIERIHGVLGAPVGGTTAAAPMPLIALEDSRVGAGEHPGTVASWGNTASTAPGSRRLYGGLAAVALLVGGAIAVHAAREGSKGAESFVPTAAASSADVRALHAAPPASSAAAAATSDGPAIAVSPVPSDLAKGSAPASSTGSPGTPPVSAPRGRSKKSEKPALRGDTPAPPGVTPARPPSGTMYDDRK